MFPFYLFVVVFIILQILDIVTTRRFIALEGIEWEGNPVGRYLYRRWKTNGLILGKVVATLPVILSYYYLTNSSPLSAYLFFSIVTGLMLFIVIRNYFSVQKLEK